MISLQDFPISKISVYGSLSPTSLYKSLFSFWNPNPSFVFRFLLNFIIHMICYL